jgi:HlyD family secretion protein
MKLRLVPFVLALLALAACDNATQNRLEGYAEADYIYISARDTGEITKLSVDEGAEVTPGEPLVALDDMRQKAALDSAEQGIMAARAATDLAKQTYERTSKLAAKGRAPKAQLDQATSDLDASTARESQADAQLTSAQQDYDDRAIAAPVAGRVEQVFRRQGERASPNEPILSILPPGNIKVPETMLSKLKLGQSVSVYCDGCRQVIPAKISFIASDAQFSPPFIYSRDEREKLVYLVEARPVDPEHAGLRPGQPLEVETLQ